MNKNNDGDIRKVITIAAMGSHHNSTRMLFNVAYASCQLIGTTYGSEKGSVCRYRVRAIYVKNLLGKNGLDDVIFTLIEFWEGHHK